MTSNLKGNLKAVVIHGDLWTFPREFQKPGLSSHNSQEMQLKVSHRLLLHHVRTSGAGQSPSSLHPSACKRQDPYGCYPRLRPKPGDLCEKPFPSVDATSINLDNSYMSFPFLYVANL